jgi:hypothetical protein
MELNLTVQMVRALRGAPITVLVLMMIERGPLAQGFIRRHTGYTDHIVHDALDLLQDYGLVNETGRYTWQLAGQNRQLPLMVQLESELATEDMSVEGLPDPVDNIEDDDPDFDSSQKMRARSQKMRADSSSSSRSLNRFNQENPPPLVKADSSQKMRTIEMLDNFGVREPARSRLAEMASVTAEVVEYHCRSAPNMSLAIYRIEHGWPVKAVEVEGTSKYIGGQFSEFIEH